MNMALAKQAFFFQSRRTVCRVSGFRWSCYGVSYVNVAVSLGMTLGFLVLCLALIGWIFRTGYRLKN